MDQDHFACGEPSYVEDLGRLDLNMPPPTLQRSYPDIFDNSSPHENFVDLSPSIPSAVSGVSLSDLNLKL